MHIFPAISPLFLCGFCDFLGITSVQPSNHTPALEPLVLHDVVTFPTSQHAIYPSSFRSDPNGDGKVDLFVSPEIEAGSMARGGDSSVVLSQNHLFSTGIGPNQNWEFHLTNPVLVNVGGEIALLMASQEGNLFSISDDFCIGVWGLNTRERLGLFSADSLPPSVPPFFEWASTFPLGDLDGDGFDEVLIRTLPDVGFGNTSTYGVFDTVTMDFRWIDTQTYLGADGSEFWKRIPLAGDPGHSRFGLVTTVSSQETASISDQDGDGVPDIAVPTDFVNPLTSTGGKWLRIFSGRSGSIRGRHQWEGISDDPWELRNGFVLSSANPRAGDLDGDDYPEWFVDVDLVNTTDSAIGLVGFQTLHHPESAQMGDDIRLGLDIPSGPGMPYRVLLSTAFAEDRSGIHYGAWNTHLLPSTVLHASLGRPELRGMLGADGKADIRFQLPNMPSLAGQTLYAVALVEDGVGKDGILTRSTIGSIELLP